MEGSVYNNEVFLYEVTAVEHWKSRGPLLASLISEYCPNAERVVDVGAGTGLAMRVATEELVDPVFFAVEPSDGMKAAMVARVAESPLNGRVTIYDSIEDLSILGTEVDLILAFGVLGHMSKDERMGFWDMAKRILTPEGIVIVELMGVEAPTFVPNRLAGRRSVGLRTYESWISGEPVDEDFMRWSITYRVLQGGSFIGQNVVSRQWETFGLERLSLEAGEAFVCEQKGESIYLLERR